MKKMAEKRFEFWSGWVMGKLHLTAGVQLFRSLPSNRQVSWVLATSTHRMIQFQWVLQVSSHFFNFLSNAQILRRIEL